MHMPVSLSHSKCIKVLIALPLPRPLFLHSPPLLSRMVCLLALEREGGKRERESGALDRWGTVCHAFSLAGRAEKRERERVRESKQATHQQARNPHWAQSRCA